jgi:hypothetical protein
MIASLNINFHVNFKVLKQIEKTFDGKLLFVYIYMEIFIKFFQNKRIFLNCFVKIIVFWQANKCYKFIPKYDCIIPMCNNFTTWS